MVDKGKRIVRPGISGDDFAIGIPSESQTPVQIFSRGAYVPVGLPRPYSGMLVDDERSYSAGSAALRAVVRVRIRMTAGMLRAKTILSSQCAIVIVNRHSISADDIIDALSSDCVSVPSRGWNVSLLRGSEYLVRFPSASDLEGTLTRPLSVDRGVVASVRRWTDGDSYSVISFAHAVWLLARGFPIQCWEPSGFFDLVSSFGWLLEIDEDTRSRRRTDAARIKVGCDNLNDILSSVDVHVEGKWRRVSLMIQHDIAMQGVPGFAAPVTNHRFFPPPGAEENWLPVSR